MKTMLTLALASIMGFGVVQTASAARSPGGPEHRPQPHDRRGAGREMNRGQDRPLPPMAQRAMERRPGGPQDRPQAVVRCPHCDKAISLSARAPAGRPPRPEQRREEARPEPQREQDRPEAKREGDRPEVKREGDRPDVKREGDRPDVKRDGDRPEPRRDEDRAARAPEGRRPLPPADGAGPRAPRGPRPPQHRDAD